MPSITTKLPLLSTTAITIAAISIVALGGCGSGDEQTPANVKSSAQMLQQAMSDTQRSIDNTRSSRSSLEKLKADLAPQISSTSDAINKLDPGSRSQVEQDLYEAAVAQRKFLQYISEAVAVKKWSIAKSNLAKARKYGRQASKDYTNIGQENSDLAGSLPDQGAFLTGSLRNNIRKADRKRKRKTQVVVSNSSATTSTVPVDSSCNRDVQSANGVTYRHASDCFARDIAERYRSSGDSNFTIYSSAKNQYYDVRCTGYAPTVCRAGVGAVVYIAD